MHSQEPLPLWDQAAPAKKTRARSRRSDPSTSREAAKTVRDRGTDLANRAKIRAALNAGPATAVELYFRLTPGNGGPGEISRHEVSRRLPEMERDGQVVRVGKRKCRVNDTLMTVWQVTESQ